MPEARRRTATMSLLVLGACAPLTRGSAVPPPAYPWSGFGRLGCYAGASLGRMHPGAPAPDAAAAEEGPWLVLDSLSATEIQRGGVTRHLTERDFRPAKLLERRDSLEWTSGYWYRVSHDSLVFEETSVFPAVVWRFRIGAAELRGEGTLVHDIATREHDGTLHRDISRWPVHVRRVPCAAVPVRPLT